MSEKVIIDDEEYELNQLSEKAQISINSLKFINKKITDLSNMKTFLLCASNSYIDNLKKEILSKKSGLDFED